VFRRYRALIAVLALGLQATDGYVSAIGHSHSDDHVACKPKCDERSCGHCAHSHPEEEQRNNSHESHQHESDGPRHDECAICRHFSQPILPTAVTIEIAENEETETIAPRYEAPLVAAARPIHPARGPPIICS
jgi:hypothetical protein